MAMMASCLACQLCVTIEEFCERAPDAFGCTVVDPILPDDSTSPPDPDLKDALNLTKRYKGAADKAVLSSEIKVTLDEPGFVYDGERNPVIRVACNSSTECDIGLEAAGRGQRPGQRDMARSALRTPTAT